MLMNKIKKIGAVIFAVLIFASFSSCGNGNDSSIDGKNTEQSNTAGAVDEMRDIPSTELVKEIKIGWNLGNTFDATGNSTVDSEKSWGNPVTTKEMITAVKDAGFNTIRIPVTWGTHMDENNVVDEAWMNRVQEVVDYAYTQDMFVILNIHHEDWHDPYYDSSEAAIEKLTALWTQIGTRFAWYDEHLIFEGMNEPRKRNTSWEWNGGDKEGHDVVNQMNEAFVSTVRSLGGNNAMRHLMIPTYAACSVSSAINDFVVPEDDDKIIVSIHAYIPYNFAFNENMNQNTFSADSGIAKEITRLMNTLESSFISKGTPVIIGEFGARSKDNEDARAEWAAFYVSNAKKTGIPCIWWDNGAFTGTGELFGLFDRINCTWTFPKIVEGLMKGLE